MLTISPRSLSNTAVFLSCLGIAHAVVLPRATQQYLLDSNYTGRTFFNGFDFFTDSDPTHGFVTYVSQAQASSNGFIKTSPAHMGVDYKNVLDPSSAGRQSVRITTQKSWTHGLFILDLTHMPSSICGVWPAYWMFGPSWPSNGEIDIIEGVNTNTYNTMSLHTGPNCVMTARSMSGNVQTMQCDSSYNYNSGCGVTANTSNTYGTSFNANNGGVYATEWTSTAIRTWLFARNSIPADITSGTPNPAGWGVPQSNFVGGSSCNIDTHFANQSVVFDTTFCGDWAGSAYSNDATCTAKNSSCVDYVAGNPKDFQAAYWQINSLKVYQMGTPAASSTTSSTTTSSVKTSTSSSSKVTTSSSYITTTTTKTTSTSFTKAATTSKK